MISREHLLSTILNICKNRKSTYYLDAPNSIIVENNDYLIRTYSLIYDDISEPSRKDNIIHESVCYDAFELEAYIQNVLNDFTNNITTIDIKIQQSYLVLKILHVDKTIESINIEPQRMKVAKNVDNV